MGSAREPRGTTRTVRGGCSATPTRGGGRPFDRPSPPPNPGPHAPPPACQPALPGTAPLRVSAGRRRGAPNPRCGGRAARAVPHPGRPCAPLVVPVPRLCANPLASVGRQPPHGARRPRAVRQAVCRRYGQVAQHLEPSLWPGRPAHSRAGASQAKASRQHREKEGTRRLGRPQRWKARSRQVASDSVERRRARRKRYLTAPPPPAFFRDRKSAVVRLFVSFIVSLSFVPPPTAISYVFHPVFASAAEDISCRPPKKVETSYRVANPRKTGAASVVKSTNGRK